MSPQEDKLRLLADAWGMSVDEMLETYFLDSTAPGICMNPGCTFTAEYEPNQEAGWCDECSTQSVRSVLILSGIY
jgi:hypothetical protein